MAKHDTDVTSLVFGLLFLGLAAVWALVQADVLTWPAASVLGPVVLVVAGLVGLLLTLRRATPPTAEGGHDDSATPTA